jgi:hypothetical protein
MVGWVGLAVAGTTRGYFVWQAGCYFFRRIKLLSSLKTRSTADRAAETVDVRMIRVLHRFFVRSGSKYEIELVCSL